MVPGYGVVFRRTGMLPDVMVQAAIEDGFLPFGAAQSDLTDLIRRAVSGERIAPLYAEGVADEEMARRINANQEANLQDAPAPADFADYLDQDYDPFVPGQGDQGLVSDPFIPEDAVGTGYDLADHDLRLEVNALLLMAEGLGIDVETIKERADEATRHGTERDYLQAARAALVAAIERANGSSQTAAVQGSAGDGSQDSGQPGAAPGQAGFLSADSPEQQAQREGRAADLKKATELA